MQAHRLLKARLTLTLTLSLLRLHLWGSSLRRTMRNLRCTALTTLAVLIFFRQPARGLRAYFGEAAVLLLPRQLTRPLVSSASGVPELLPQNSKGAFSDIRIPRAGILQSSYAFLRNLFAGIGSDKGAVLEDRRLRRLQSLFVSRQFEKLFGIEPAEEELEVLSAFAGVDWLYRALVGAAGHAVSDRLTAEALYRVRVAYPTFVRLLRLRLNSFETDFPAQQLRGLYPHRITIARFKAAESRAFKQTRAERLSATVAEELARLRLHFAAGSIFERAELRRPYEAESILHKFEKIHFPEKRRQ